MPSGAGEHGRRRSCLGPAEYGRFAQGPLPAGHPGTGDRTSPRWRPMLLEPDGPALVVRAPAKVNLFLEVLRRRDDGYHDLATLMVAVGLYDTLELREDPDGAVSLRCD